MKTYKSKIKVGDKVKVFVGKDAGKEGKVEKIDVKNGKILVENVNLAKKHVKPRGQQPGGIQTITLPIDISNVKVVCSACGKPTKIRFEGEGRNKQRICSLCKAPINKVENQKK